MRFWVGGYGDCGIAQAELDPLDGRIRVLARTECGPDPSYLCRSADGHHLFAVHETGEEGSVSSFRVAEGGTLEPVSLIPTPGGAGCHVAQTEGGLLVSAYGSGRLFVIEESGGALVRVAQTLSYPGGRDLSHAHQAVVSPCGAWVLVCDLGADCVWAHPVSREAGPTPLLGDPVRNPMPPGSGPRHLVFRGGFVHVAHELQPLLTTWRLDGDGRLAHVRTTRTLPAKSPHKGWAAAVRSHRTGVLVSTRDPDGLVMVTRGKTRSVPTPGQTPRDFAVSPDGRWAVVAFQGSSTVQALRLARAPFWGPATATPKPTCVLFA